jgi:disulfide bond formation protein DsbB
MAFWTSTRGIFLLIFLLCCAFMGYALYSQHVLGLQPCNLCVLQRYAMVGLGAVCAIAALHGPRGWGARIYGVIALVVASAGAGVALKHHNIQNMSDEQKLMLTCEAPLDYLLENKTWGDALKVVFSGGGNCGDVDWTFLGLGMPGWVLVWFCIFALLLLWRAVIVPQHRR